MCNKWSNKPESDPGLSRPGSGHSQLAVGNANAFIYFNSATTLPLCNQCRRRHNETYNHMHTCKYISIYGGSSSYVCIYACPASCVQCPVSRVLCRGPRQSLITFRTQRRKNNKCKWRWRRGNGHGDNDEAATIRIIIIIRMAMMMMMMMARTRRRLAHQTPLLPLGPRPAFGHETKRGRTRQTRNALKIHNFQIIFNDFKYT